MVGIPTAVEQARVGAGEITRRDFVLRSAGVVAAASGLYAAAPGLSRAAANDAAAPKPIPGGFSASFKPVAANPAAHVFQPLRGGELNTIGDFNGFVAAAEIQGKAKGSDGTAYGYDCDMRFMQGSYVALDGQLRHGSFGFI